MLTEQQRFDIWRDFMSHPDFGIGLPLGVFGNITKTEIREIVNCIADGVEIPKNNLTTAQLSTLEHMVEVKKNPPLVVKTPDPRIATLEAILKADMGITKNGVAEKIVNALAGA